MQPKLISRQHFLLLHLDAQHALVDHLDLLDQRDTESETCARFAKLFALTIRVYHTVDLTIAADNRLLRFGYDSHRHAEQYQSGNSCKAEIKRITEKCLVHCFFPVTVTGSSLGTGRLLNSGIGK